MYHMNPIITSDIHIEYPTSMYKLKPISTDDSTEIFGNNLNLVGKDLADQTKVKNTDMEELEFRQETILKHLNELKDRLTLMQEQLKICNKQAVSLLASKAAKVTPTTQKPIDSANLREIIINANPSNIPYSLLALKKLWTHRLSVTLQFYTHSTVSGLTQPAINFQNLCTAHQSTSSANLNITLIWKNIDNIEMINGSSSPVIGESNILRYLARIGPNEFNYESNGSNYNEIDSQLDLSELLISASTAKERQTIFKTLNTTLGKNEFFGGTEPQINDFSLASAVLQSKTEKEIPPPLLKWSRKIIAVN